jgi:thymidine phosphorylase
LPEARALAHSLVRVANGAGLPTRAWITDMNQVLGYSCGNALEVREALAFLDGSRQEPRLLEVTRTLSAELLQLGGLVPDLAQGLQRVDAALASGQALERFARMVQALGGPADLCARPDHYLARAPVQHPVLAPHAGWVRAMDTRAIGLLVIDLGGGRHKATDAVDPRVGFSQVAQIGQRVEAGDVLALVHAANADAAAQAGRRLCACIQWSDAPVPTSIAMLERLEA